jgi:hypothetical protein
MTFKKLTAAALTALLFAAGTASADEDHNNLTNFDNDRYNFHIEGANQMIFNNPVSFTGEVKAQSLSHRTLEAANGMMIRVPNQAMVWNGDTQMFAQSTNIGDEVVIHMRNEEGYRIMDHPAVNAPWVAVGSYEGVFYFPEDFIRDFALNELDDNIYADGWMDEDVAYDDDEVEAVIVTDRDPTDGEVTVTSVMDDDDNLNRHKYYDIDLKSVNR